MSKPIIKLTAIKLHQGLSQETPAYTANLLVDGKKIGTLSNDGHGGCDYFHGDWEVYGKVNERVKNHAENDIEKYGLECVCHTLVWQSADIKKMKGILRRKIVATVENGEKVIEWNRKPIASRPNGLADFRKFAESKYPGIQWLDDMEESAQFEIIFGESLKVA